MRIDPPTLLDLEITATEQSAHSLFGLLDRTVSKTGHARLRERVHAPLGQADEICDAQAALRLLATQTSLLQATIRRIAPDQVRRYLDSSWDISIIRHPVLRMVEGVWMRIRYAAFLAESRTGLKRIAELLTGAKGIADGFRTAPSTLLQGITQTIDQALQASSLAPLRGMRARPGLAETLRLDRVARKDALDPILQLLQAAAEVDALTSLAAATAEHGWTFPDVIDGPLEIRGLRHPLLPNGVANDLVLDNDTRLILLTGPNMAGKTTWLKTVGLAQFMAHLGCGVSAASMRFRPLTALMSSIQVNDDLAHGESFYLAEVRRVGALATVLADGTPSLALIDEPFRGTNLHDAAEASRLLFDRLARHPHAVSMVATHLTEVVEQVGKMPGVRLASFDALLEGEVLRFDFRLREGISHHRLGMELLRREGVIDLLQSW